MKRHELIIVGIMICSIFLISNISALIIDMPLKDKVIYLDAGHGGIDPGSLYKDIYEKDINLAIVLSLKEELEIRGATVHLTRENDDNLVDTSIKERKRSDLYKRVTMINKSGADMYLSIHLNSSLNTSLNGAQAFYSNINNENVEIARTMQKVFNKRINVSVKDKEITKITDLYMYKIIKVPGILIEAGFISNPSERKLLNTEEYQKKLAILISDTVVKYYNK